MNPAHSSPHGMKAKLLAVALGLCLAGTAHSPRVEASGIPVVDGLNQAFNMIIEEARAQSRRMINECFEVNNLRDAVQRVQAIQRINLRTTVNGSSVKLSEAMPEITDLHQGADQACPTAGRPGLAGAAADSIRGAIGLANKNLDGSTNLAAEQQSICRTLVYMRNKKWNTERQVLVELEQQTDELAAILNGWNSRVGSGGGSVVGSITSGCSLNSGNGPGEGWQATEAAKLQANAERSERLFKNVQTEAEVYQSVINTLEKRQAEVAQRLMSGDKPTGLLETATQTLVQGAILGTALRAGNKTCGDDFGERRNCGN